MLYYIGFGQLKNPVPKTEDDLCERWLTKSTLRDTDGRFCIALPFRHPVFINDDGIQITNPKSGIRSSTRRIPIFSFETATGLGISPPKGQAVV
ncbi:unnamed protein product [Macrosiphum euphorbiae]|uniref:Uncharacterized protein n=1 Tax=Macrosiphum euphorbiae TaxID=13131 RepID=A0AAV0WR26_9HEMI|nr:unnamed protein product [Macrosiphum euphorbiae]